MSGGGTHAGTGPTVLTVNAGSTSLKVASRRADGTTVGSLELDAVLDGPRPDAVAHRVVHGGERSAAAVVDDEVVAELRGLTELAPLHQPPALAALDRVRRAWPRVPQVACFDTAFHRTIPPAAATYALPEPYRRTVRVFGFHGLSHAWSSSVAAAHVPTARRVLVAHLGGGASLCAVRDGVSVETTMGFTPLDGLVMGSRSGHLDPGALLWLAQHTDENLADLLERRSGLQGLAGTDDMREVLARREQGETAATFAFEVYLHRLVTQTGAMVAAMQGLDALVFTGGVGEHCRPVREQLCRQLRWLGVQAQDRDLTGTDDVVDLTAPGATVRTLVVPAREDLQMVTEAGAALGW